MRLNPRELEYTVNTLLKAVARNRIEIHSLRIALVDAGVASLETLDQAREIASRRYADLLRLVSEDLPEKTDLLEFLKAFQGPVQ